MVYIIYFVLMMNGRCIWIITGIHKVIGWYLIYRPLTTSKVNRGIQVSSSVLRTNEVVYFIPDG